MKAKIQIAAGKINTALAALWNRALLVLFVFFLWLGFGASSFSILNHNRSPHSNIHNRIAKGSFLTESNDQTTRRQRYPARFNDNPPSKFK